MNTSNPSKGALLIIAVFLTVLLGSAPLFLPKPALESVPPDRFSAERAMRTVQALAQKPRLAGTAGMEKAAEYVAAGLRNCNLAPEIQGASSPRGILRNVVVRIPGNQPGNTILILTHVDSVSLGAGDNASGAAVLLEVACSLQAGKPLRNDVILLFEDGEEEGYLGGYAFAETDTSISTIRRVIGLDTAAWGPVVLLQTTPRNADLIRAYASSVHDPTAFAFFADADWNISNDTSEIQPFYERGIPGLELEDPTAFVGKHSEADTIEYVKPGSLQQMGDQALALARSLGDSDLTTFSTSDLSFFTLWGLGVIHYPASWNMIFAILAGIGLVGLVIRAIRQKVIKLRAVVLSTILLFPLVISAGVVGIIGDSLFKKLFPSPNPHIGSYLIPASMPFFLAIVAIVVLVYIFVRGKLATSFGSPAVRLAGLCYWVLLAVVFAALLPVGSVTFTLPLLSAILVCFFPAKLKFIQFIPAAIAMILLAPNIVLAFLGAGMEVLVLVNILVILNAELWIGSKV